MVEPHLPPSPAWLLVSSSTSSLSSPRSSLPFSPSEIHIPPTLSPVWFLLTVFVVVSNLCIFVGFTFLLFFIFYMFTFSPLSAELEFSIFIYLQYFTRSIFIFFSHLSTLLFLSRGPQPTASPFSFHSTFMMFRFSYQQLLPCIAVIPFKDKKEIIFRACIFFSL